MTRSLNSILQYATIGLLIVVVLALTAGPFSSSLVEKWSRSDVEARSRLVYNSIHGLVVRAMTERAWDRLSTIFEGVARDERILAVGLCTDKGVLVEPTELMPRSFSCQAIARSGSESYSTVVYEDRRILVGAFPISQGEHRAYLLVLHDLSFIDARSGQIQKFAIASLAIAGLAMAAVAATFTVFMLRRWMRSLRMAAAEISAGRPLLIDGELSGLEAEVQTLLKEIESSRVRLDTSQIEFSPKTLQELLQSSLPGAEILVVSNREPYIHNRSDGTLTMQRPASGLVSALEPVMRSCGGVWIAHGSGDADRETVDENDRIEVPPGRPAYTLRRVWISDEEQDGYYYGLANEGLWPLCHIAFVRPIFREPDWQTYERINERFAVAVTQEARSENPVVLVQDYHFALLPRMIRARLPKATIITFWHIPWPNAETFSICPWKEKIIDGLLGSTILGFHTQFHCNNFMETVDRFVESRINREHATVSFRRQETMIRPYPISIEWPPKALSEQPSIEQCRCEIRQAFGLPADVKLAVGIERFDYTKGILDRMRAVDILLAQNESWKGRFVFLQIAAPTRSKLAAYSGLQHEAQALANEINARHGVDGYRPILLVVRHHEPDEVFKLFRAADLCVVSSLHDGMNLVAKEFVASRDDEQGVLVLSSFTGASREMAEALIVNPYDAQEMASAMEDALRMPAHEQRERMRPMRQQVRESNVYRWAGRMLIDAARCRQRQRILDIAERNRRQ